MDERIKILVLSNCYLPGYKAGGPIRSISGMIQSLGDEFDFRVLTLDRDLGDARPYPGITCGEWTPVGKAQVMYWPPADINLGFIERILCETPHDLVYLGGAFGRMFVLRFLFLRRLGRVKRCPVVLAPQGVFSEGALRIKARKKKLFMAMARAIGLYDGLTWHVSTPFEKRDVVEALHLRGESRFVVVEPGIEAVSEDLPPFHRRRSSERLQAVFLSRISPKKNLDGALRILQGADIPIDFHIYGPAEDQLYWRLCQEEIGKLPPNVTATYHGPVAHSEVAAVMRSHDLFFMPTHGENFGHVIIEALREGCPALIADTTAFRNLEQRGAGWDLPLDDVAGFRRILREYATMSDEQREFWSRGARRLVSAITANGRIAETYRTAFREIVAGTRTSKAA
jgi:glycosyltransferase involved in cell wall biosynthesis